MAEDEGPSEGPLVSAGWADLVRAVGQFGLSEKEAALYLAALRRRRATASELARDAGIDRVVGYRLLEAMRAQGLVEITVERPRRFVATTPSVLLARVLRRRRERLTRDEVTAREITEALERFGVQEGSGSARYQIVTGTSRAWEHFREMIERAREEISVLSTARGLRDAFRVDLHHHLGPFLERGGRFRLLAESDPRIQGLLDRFSALAQRYPQSEVRQLAPQPSRVTIVDRSEVIVFLVPDAHLGALEQIAVWTNHTDFVAGQMAYFKAMWERAGSGSLRPPAPASPSRTTPATRGSRRATGAMPRRASGSIPPPPRG